MVSRLAAVAAVMALAVTGVVAGVAPSGMAGGSAAAEPAVAAAAAGCDVLDAGETCTFAYADYPDGVRVTFADAVSTVMVLAAAGSGAEGEGGGGAPTGGGGAGAGALVIGELPITDHSIPLTAQLGSAATGREQHGVGWSDGGKGGYEEGTLSSGGAGGGSTGVGYGDGLLLVAGGGGGGGGCVFQVETTFWTPTGTCQGGGSGGSGGHPDLPAGPGTSYDSESNGSAGSGGRQNVPWGGEGTGFPDLLAVAGGGGGGGGYSGGTAGQAGELACGGDYKFSYCKQPQPGAGGGGGAGSTYIAEHRFSRLWTMTAPPGDGFLTLIAGEAEELTCAPTFESRSFAIDPAVDVYTVIAVGGSGSRGHNGTGSEGRGGAVVAEIATAGQTEFAYWVGCSPYYENGGAWGFGRPGHGGTGTTDPAKTGGDGGNATAVAFPEAGGGYLPLLVAGGGGGSGGDLCVGDCTRGGHGGNGGGVRGTANTVNGEDGQEDLFGVRPGRGGCGACIDGRWGDDGTDGGGSGGGGGGGAGYPSSGHGGGASPDASGGGGGAGASYVSGNPRVLNAAIGTDDSVGEGFILLVPQKLPKTTLTVQKAVTGDAADFATGPFAVEVSCQIDGLVLWSGTIELAPTGSYTLPPLRTGAECDLAETDAGGASTPASSRTITLTGATQTEVLTNEFAAGSVSIDVHSVIEGEGGAPNPGVSFDLATVFAFVGCSLDGRALRLPGGNVVAFDGDATWAGLTHTITGLPVGAACTVTAVSKAPDTAYAVDGESQSGHASFTVNQDDVDVRIEPTYPLGSLGVTKSVVGEGAPGAVYEVEVTCTFDGRPVTLAPGGSSLSLVADGNGTLSDLPIGAVCELVETDHGGATSVAFSPSSHVIVGASPAVTVTNTFATDPLTVTLTDSGTGAAWANLPVSATVSCSLDGEPLAPIVLEFPVGGGSQTVDVDEGAVCALSAVGDAGQVATRYASSAAPGWSGSPVDIVVAAGAGLRVDQVFDTAPVQLTTTTSGTGAVFANLPTSATIGDCTFNGIPGGVSTEVGFGIHGGTAFVDGIVVGAHCRVTQTDGAGATDTTYSVVNAGDVDADGADVVVSAPGTQVGIDNRFDAVAFTVDKEIAGAGGWAADTEYAVTATCTFNDLPLEQLGAGGVAQLRFAADGSSIATAGSAALASLPVGADCVVAETQSGGATSTEYLPSATAEVTLGARVTVRNTFETGSLAIAVTVAGNDLDRHLDDVFTFDQHCTFNGQVLAAPQTVPPWQHAPVLPAGGSIVFDGLPVGATCSVLESGTNWATTVDPAPLQTVTITAGGATLAFENVFDVAPVALAVELEGDGVEAYGASQRFIEQLECRYLDGSRALLPNDGKVEFSEAVGWSAVTSAPLDAACTMVPGSGHLATSVRWPVWNDVGPDGIELSVSYAYLLETVTVRKDAVGLDDPSTRFGFTAACSYQDAPLPLVDPADSAFSLHSGATETLQALRNAQCTVREADAGGAERVDVAAIGDGAVTGDGTAVAYLVDQQPVAFTFLNWMPGSLPVTGAGSWLPWAGALAGSLFAAGGAILVVRRLRRRTERASV